MQRRVKQYLYIHQSCLAITSFFEGKTIEEYQQNDMLHSAVERKCEIIGEAVNQIPQYDPSMDEQLTHARNSIGFRSRLIHGYDINTEKARAVITSGLPPLTKDVGELLNEGSLS